jgi:hypothetical protein
MLATVALGRGQQPRRCTRVVLTGGESTGVLYWCDVLVRCTGAMYWCDVLVQCAGAVCWCSVLVQCTGAVCWCSVLVQCAGAFTQLFGIAGATVSGAIVGVM